LIVVVDVIEDAKVSDAQLPWRHRILVEFLAMLCAVVGFVRKLRDYGIHDDASIPLAELLEVVPGMR
jgi:hypothetical protein